MNTGKRKKKAEEVEHTHGSQGRAAFVEVRDELAKTPPEARVNPNVDLQDAGTAALGVLALLKTAAAKERIAKLVSIKEAAPGVVERAEQLAWAAIHVRRKQVLTARSESEANVSGATIALARTLRGTMRKVCDHNLLDPRAPNAELERVLDALRDDTGALDLANDLEGYADLYEEHPEELARDGTYYSAGDVPQARKLAHEIYVALGLEDTEGSENWAQLQGALWPLFVTAYEAAAVRVGRFLFPGADAEQRFPSLVTAARVHSGTARSGKKKAEEKGEGKGGEEKKGEGEKK